MSKAKYIHTTDRPTFTTERLNVFAICVKHREAHDPRTLFIGFFRDEDWPGQVVTMTIWEGAASAMGGPYIKWIETSTPHRRQGLARELWRAVVKYIGQDLVGDGASEEGDALCDAMSPCERCASPARPAAGEKEGKA